jgi:hypothetical protein
MAHSEALLVHNLASNIKQISVNNNIARYIHVQLTQNSGDLALGRPKLGHCKQDDLKQCHFFQIETFVTSNYTFYANMEEESTKHK